MMRYINCLYESLKILCIYVITTITQYLTIKFHEHFKIFMVIWANNTDRLVNKSDMPLSDRKKNYMGTDVTKKAYIT